jgi:hypothetical protein
MKGLEHHLKLVPEEEKEYTTWNDLEVTSWTVNTLQGLPQQEDKTSDALFMLKFIEHWHGDRITKKFTQAFIDGFRHKLAALLFNSSLNEYKEIWSTDVTYS